MHYEFEEGCLIILYILVKGSLLYTFATFIYFYLCYISYLWSIYVGDLDMSKWANPVHTGWLTTSRVENERTQLNSFYGESEIL